MIIQTEINAKLKMNCKLLTITCLIWIGTYSPNATAELFIHCGKGNNITDLGNPSSGSAPQGSGSGSSQDAAKAACRQSLQEKLLDAGNVASCEDCPDDGHCTLSTTDSGAGTGTVTMVCQKAASVGGVEKHTCQCTLKSGEELPRFRASCSGCPSFGCAEEIEPPSGEDGVTPGSSGPTTPGGR